MMIVIVQRGLSRGTLKQLRSEEVLGLDGAGRASKGPGRASDIAGRVSKRARRASEGAWRASVGAMGSSERAGRGSGGRRKEKER